MGKKTKFFWFFFIILILIFWYNFLSKKPLEKVENKITIFTLNPLLGIHAKAIVGDDSSVYVSSDNNLTPQDRLKFDNASIVLWEKTLNESELSGELQGYRWLYVTIPSTTKKDSITYPIDAITSQIELIRNTLSEVDPENRGYYYDNAGNYIHRLLSTTESLQSRINWYSPVPFLTLGYGLQNFLDTFWLQKYHIKNYKTLSELSSDKKLWDLIKNKSIRYIFISDDSNSAAIKNLEKKYNIIAYKLPSLNEDASSWGYSRLLEKIMNDFISAFDTYD